jgi:hypothetical protein
VGIGEMHTIFWWGKLKERVCLEDLEIKLENNMENNRMGYVKEIYLAEDRISG